MSERDASKAPETSRVPVPPLIKVDSSALFAGWREVVIVHNGEQYRLRITRQEKLILTK
jgi:hemin uptake protein HemP